MVNDDIVPTSDPEELEELRAVSPTYWSGDDHPFSKAAQRGMAEAVGLRAYHRGHSDAKDFDAGSSARTSRAPGSPWKRRKLSHPLELLSQYGSPTATQIPSSPTSDRRCTSPLSPSPSVLPTVPVVQSDEDEPVTVAGYTTDRMGSQGAMERPPISFSPDKVTVGTRPFPQHLPTSSSGTPTRYRSPFANPLLLFTPSRHPPGVLSYHRANSSPGSSPPHRTSPQSSSPLTPVQSPILRRRASSAGSSTDHYSPSRGAPLNTRPLPEAADEHPAEQLAGIEQAVGRYSLRARLARQKNPYAYDKAMYKRQMRSNPDAIVQMVSPRRHGNHCSRSAARLGDEDTGDEYVGADDEQEPEDEWERQRRKSRSRSVFADKLELEEGNNSQGEQPNAWPPSRRSASRQPGVTDATRPIWQPSAFDESFSSSDDEDLAGAADGEDEASAKKMAKKRPASSVRKRAKPFPMRKKDLVPDSPSPERPAQVPRDGHVSVTDLTINDASDGNADEPLPTWRRRKSTVSISLQTPTSSPTRSIADTSACEAPSPVFAHDFFQSGSPGLPPSSTPMAVDPPSVNVDHTFGSSPGQLGEHSDSDVAVVSAGLQFPPGSLGDDSDESSGNRGDSPTDEMSTKDRKRMRVLRRMMPQIMIKQLQNRPSARARRPATPSDSSGEEPPQDANDLLRPGQSRIRLRAHSERTNLEIRGDSESSDVEILNAPLEAAESSVSSSESDMDRVIIWRRPQPHTNAVQIEDDSEDEGTSDSDVVEVPKPSHPKPSTREGEALEQDLIDRMLTRTRISGTMRRKKRSTGARNSRGGRRETTARPLHIVAAGARRMGSGRQTLLPFGRASSSRSISPVEHRARSDELHVQVRDAPSKTSKSARKRKEPRNQGSLFMFAGEAGRLVSGRAHNAPVTLDTEQAIRDPVSILRPANHDYSSDIISRPRWKRQGTSAADVEGHVLQDYWADNATSRAHVRAPVEDNDRHGVPSRRVTVDLDIPFLPSGISFATDCYLGQGFLHELVGLISAEGDVLRPNSCSLLEFDLYPTMSTQELELVLDKLCQQIRDLFVQRKFPSVEDSRSWQLLFHSVSQHISWLLSQCADDDYNAVRDMLENRLSQLGSVVEEPLEVLPEDEDVNVLELESRWFVLEAFARLEHHGRQRSGQVEAFTTNEGVNALLVCLWNLGFQGLLDPFMKEHVEVSANGYTSRRISELWVSVIHFVGAWAPCMDPHLNESARLHSVWHALLGLLHHEDLLRGVSSEVAASETLWRSIFTLCALSQFSVHGTSTSLPRIPASWLFVVATLERIKLVADPNLEATLSTSSLHKRDEYIRILVARSLVLSRRWRWPLDDATILFNRLLDIFKSRRFANLSDEGPELPSFLRHSDLSLLSENKRSDTAFTLLLKLVVKAASDTRTRSDGSQGLSPKVKKLLSLCVPIGSVPFTKATPPSEQQLSLLYNRFSAVAVSVFLEPLLGNVKHRLANARRYVNFKDADPETRRACIRGLMHLAIMLRHLRLPLDDIFEWLSDMTNVLVDEYVQARSSGHDVPQIVLGVQILLGCVRRIIETPLMEPGQNISEYPDPAFLTGPWVKRVFSLETQLSSHTMTGVEIRKLVQSFLDARAAALPQSRPVRPSAETAEDSQESQEYFGIDDMNWDDPELVAALDPENSAKGQELKRKDEIVCEVIARDISDTIYRLVMKHFNHPTNPESLEQYSDETDRWVDCWVGCANVLVQNHKRDWEFFLNLGPQSWQKISDDSWRHRVGLRFMLMVLRLDHSAYASYKAPFLNVLAASLVAAKATVEHEYTSCLFSVDGLRHPLLRGIPCELDEASGGYKLTRQDFVHRRPSFVQKILENLAHTLLAGDENDAKVRAQHETYIGSIVTMFSTMKNVQQSLPADSEEHARYTSLCQQIYNYISPFPILKTSPRLVPYIHWMAALQSRPFH